MRLRLGLAVLVVFAVLGATVQPAQPFFHTAQRLYSEDLYSEAIRVDDFSDHPPQRGMGWLIYRQTAILPVLTDEMIRDEHLVVVEAFGHNTTTVLPFLSAQMYLLYSRTLHSQLQMAEPEQKTRIYRKIPEPGIPVMLKLLFPGYVNQTQSVGLLQGQGARQPSGSASGILGWLFEDEGVFSGRDWSWDNFLPRILSVTALVVVGLLFIEFLRFLVLLAVRSIGNADRKQP